MSAGANAADLVLLHIGPSTLALPRREVRDLLEPPARGAKIRVGDADVPVLLLDDTLQPCAAAPARRRICVLLEDSGRRYGVLCDEFEHRIDASKGRVKAHELPPSMRMPRSPVIGLLQIGQTVALLTNARALAEVFPILAEAATEVA